MNKRNVVLGIVLVVLLGLLFVFRGCTVRSQTPVTTESFLPASTSTHIDPPETGWVFQGFSEKKSYKDGFEYSWGKFEHANGMKLTAMCSSPNSPDPKVGDEFTWDKMINILVPVRDNEQGNIQRFWYPTVLE